MNNAVLTTLFLMTGCSNPPSFMDGSSGRYSSSHRTDQPRDAGEDKKTVKTETSSGGDKTVATVGPEAKEAQVVSVPGGSLKGARLEFPPGSIAIETDLAIEEGAQVADSAATSEMGLDASVMSSSPALIVMPTVASDPATPFRVSLSIPPRAALAGDDMATLVVIFRVRSYADSSNLLGLIPMSELSITEDGMVSFSSRYFGSFQAAFLSKVVHEKKIMPTATPAMTKNESKSLSSMTVTSRTPFIVKNGDTVELKGANFRRTLTVAQGGRKVGGLKVASDSSATFQAASDSAGVFDLTVEQDGVSQKVSLVYAGDLPISSLPDSEICRGIKFYGVAGDVRTGSKDCLTNSSTATTTTAPTTAPTTTISIPQCDGNAQVGCVTNQKYRSADLSKLSPANIRNGVDVAGVRGDYPSKNSPLAGEFQISPENLRSGVEFLGVVGTLVEPKNIPECSADGAVGCLTTERFRPVDTETISPWDVRSGVVLGGTYGEIEFARNAGDETTYDGGHNMTGDPLENPATIEDYNRGKTTDLRAPAGWPAATAKNFRRTSEVPVKNARGDLTSNTAPCGEGEVCVVTDLISGVTWGNPLTDDGSFDTAVSVCSSLVLGGHSDWRLPTQKEVLQAFIDGIWLAEVKQQGTGLPGQGLIWSSTTSSTEVWNAWSVSPATGATTTTEKNQVLPFLCVASTPKPTK